MRTPRIGYFGGTFDPPHLGHQILAGETMHQLGLDQVHWIITPDPPHKSDQEITSQKHRLEMLNRIASLSAEFIINQVEVHRPPPHYAADTVEILKSNQPDADLVFIIGEDSLRDLPDWYEPTRFVSAIDLLAVFPRPGFSIDLDEIAELLPGLREKIEFIKGVEIEISSSVIRERAARREAFEHFLSPEVAEYIHSNSLYQS